MYRCCVFLIFVLLFLSACVPVTDSSGDPAMRALKAQAEMTGTAQANAERSAKATITAAVALEKSQQEIDQQYARLAIKETEHALVNGIATATAGVATMQAGFATSTSEAYSGMATRTALEEIASTKRKDEEFQRAMKEFWAWFLPVVIFVVGSILLIIGGMFLYNLATRYLDRLERHGTYKETRFGIMVWDPDENGYYHQRMIAGTSQDFYRPRQDLNRLEKPEVTDLGNSGNVLSSPIPKSDNTTTALVMRLVEESEQRLGGSSNKLLGYRDLGWYADQWERAVKALQSLGIARAQQGKGTYLVGEYECLFDLHTALQQRKIKIRPSPTPSGGD